ncbi:MAG: trimeric intracellular cation channel family protein [Bacteroidales bacterium]|nr:trimeric intracellular cation channel family protein [Bacteroidales bacterium]
MDIIYTLLMTIGAVSFAISGALTALQKRFDVFGVLIIAFATATGGGTIRDILIGNRVFWLIDPTYIYLIILGTIISILFRRKLNYLRNTLLFFDTIGLGLFTVLGTQIGLNFELSGAASVALGTITGAFGGVLRDVLVNDIPVIFRKEVYATISILGGSLYILLKKLDINELTTHLVPVFLIIILRFIVIHFKIALPSLYRKSKSN